MNKDISNSVKIFRRLYPIVFLLFLTSACSSSNNKAGDPHEDKGSVITLEIHPGREEAHPLAEKMEEAGLVDVKILDSTLLVDIKYASEDNFLGEDIYNGMDKAYLQPEVARMLVRANEYLKDEHPDLFLIVYDAARPRSAQQKMWDAVDAPFSEKVKFLSNPANGSVHNFGAAVDVAIVDNHENILDMGTCFDYMGPLAYPVLEEQHLKTGNLTPEQVKNRELLRKVMIKAGFSGIRTEWWHFNAMSRSEARSRYQIIE